MSRIKRKYTKRQQKSTRYACILLRKAIRNDGATASEMTESQLLTRLALQELEKRE